MESPPFSVNNGQKDTWLCQVTRKGVKTNQKLSSGTVQIVCIYHVSLGTVWVPSFQKQWWKWYRCRRKAGGMVQRLEHFLNGEKLNQQGLLCGKETSRVNKIMGGVETRNRECLFTLCCNSTDINGRKKNSLRTGLL